MLFNSNARKMALRTKTLTIFPIHAYCFFDGMSGGKAKPSGNPDRASSSDGRNNRNWPVERGREREREGGRKEFRAILRSIIQVQ